LAHDVATAFERYERAGPPPTAFGQDPPRIRRSARRRAIVFGSATNARRSHKPALADPVGAKAYIDREWSRAAITSRYEWLFTYDVLSAEI
jgi:hypothetical protein